MDNEPGELIIPSHAETAKDLELPSNAAERKRVLNILAQRRYRRRRREKHTALELLVSRTTNARAAPPSGQHIPEIGISLETNSSPSSEDSTASSSDLTVPYMNGSTWWPIDVDPGMDIENLLQNDGNWSSTDFETSSLTTFLQCDEIASATFADDVTIAIPELDLLRAAYSIAGRLRSSHLLFAGMEAQSIFTSAGNDCTTWTSSLPANLRPTTSQLTTPHHPLIDVLPWPSVRNKLIGMYRLPPELWPRHPSDGTASSIVRLVYDMEDGGVRVSGSDPADEKAWEVEQGFFDVWWWALDQRVVDSSNRKRATRGLPRLCAGREIGVG